VLLSAARSLHDMSSSCSAWVCGLLSLSLGVRSNCF